MKEKSVERTPHGDDPGVYIFGRRSLVIDGKAVLYDYSEKTAVFAVPGKKRRIRVEGKKLTVRICGPSASEVKGRIDSVSFVSVDDHV